MKLKLDLSPVKLLSKGTIAFIAASFSSIVLSEIISMLNNHLLSYYWWSCYWSCLYSGFSL